MVIEVVLDVVVIQTAPCPRPVDAANAAVPAVPVGTAALSTAVAGQRQRQPDP